MVIYLTVVLIYTSLMTNDVDADHIFHGLIYHVDVFFGKTSVEILC